MVCEEEAIKVAKAEIDKGLNPCFNGIWSARVVKLYSWETVERS